MSTKPLPTSMSVDTGLLAWEVLKLITVTAPGAGRTALLIFQGLLPTTSLSQHAAAVPSSCHAVADFES
jgi:hypothetical protein